MSTGFSAPKQWCWHLPASFHSDPIASSRYLRYLMIPSAGLYDGNAGPEAPSNASRTMSPSSTCIHCQSSRHPAHGEVCTLFPPARETSFAKLPQELPGCQSRAAPGADPAVSSVGSLPSTHPVGTTTGSARTLITGPNLNSFTDHRPSSIPKLAYRGRPLLAACLAQFNDRMADPQLRRLTGPMGPWSNQAGACRHTPPSAERCWGCGQHVRVG